jgi:hypothetical protein
MDYCTVTVIQDDVVSEQFVFWDGVLSAAKQAEIKFLSLCEEYISNWDEYTKHDIDVILDNGYTSVNGRTICIFHPELS